MQFAPDQVLFGDVAGYGMWDIGHGREHRQFVGSLALAKPSLLIPDFPLLTLLGFAGDAKSRLAALDSHARAHLMLRGATGIAGIDLNAVDLDDQQAFYDWQQFHAAEHVRLRAALGIT